MIHASVIAAVVGFVIAFAGMFDARSAMFDATAAAPTPPGLPHRTSPIEHRTSFTTYAIYLDPHDQPLAAYQFEFTAPAGAKIVGIEGGEHAAYQQPPYYDPAAMMNERLIAAAFSTADAAALPASRTRIATIHIQLPPGVDAEPTVKLTVAGAVGGGRIDADISLVQGVQP